MADMKSARREITKARRAARAQAKREFKTAPLSGVIRLAIADLEAVERSKKYVVNMDVWHAPMGRLMEKRHYAIFGAPRLDALISDMESAGASCTVCFAGAVMANRFGTKPTVDTNPDAFEDAVKHRLEALNSVRDSEWGGAAVWMDLDADTVRKAVGRINVPTYGPKTRSRFKIQLLNAATRLEKAGL